MSNRILGVWAMIALAVMSQNGITVNWKVWLIVGIVTFGECLVALAKAKRKYEDKLVADLIVKELSKNGKTEQNDQDNA